MVKKDIPIIEIINNKSIKRLLGIADQAFPKYSRPLMVRANTFARSTDKKIVGHLSTLFLELKPKSLKDWTKKYNKKHPDALDNASKKLYDKLQDFKTVIESLSIDDVKRWMKEFLYEKTYMGLSIQKAILILFSRKYQIEYRESTETEEGKDIDGWLGTVKVSVKPVTFKDTKHLPYRINDDIHVVFYEKKDGSVVIQYSQELEEACRSQVVN